MNYYIVFQNDAFEIGCGNQEVFKGDIIFNYVGGAIVSVGMVEKKTYPNNKGDELEVEYSILEQKLHVKKIFSQLRKLMPDGPSPFTQQGRKAEGYLYALNQACGELMMEKIMEVN